MSVRLIFAEIRYFDSFSNRFWRKYFDTYRCTLNQFVSFWHNMTHLTCLFLTRFHFAMKNQFCIFLGRLCYPLQNGLGSHRSRFGNVLNGILWTDSGPSNTWSQKLEVNIISMEIHIIHSLLPINSQRYGEAENFPDENLFIASGTNKHYFLFGSKESVVYTEYNNQRLDILQLGPIDIVQ